MANVNLPPPGVSNIGGNDGSTEGALPPRRPHAVRDVAQRAIDNGKARRIQTESPIIQGANRSKMTILEVDLPIRDVEIGTAVWVSADGETYKIRYKDPKSAKFLPQAIDRLIWATLREIVLDPSGQSALGLFSAMKLAMPDSDNKPLFPITVEMLRNARSGPAGVMADATHDEPLHPDADGFSIGEDPE